jgi:hypothetical protein
VTDEDLLTLVITLAVGVPFLVVWCFYLFTLQRAMSVVDDPPLPAGLVWLALIPVVGSIWIIVYVCLLGSAMDKQLMARNIDERTMGLTVAFAVLCACLMIPIVNLLAMIPFLVVWIIHWVKMASVRQRLISGA